MARVTSLQRLQRDAPPTARPLTRRQELFVLEYLKDFNGTQAAIRAGYSKHTADTIAFENMQKPGIKNRIDEALAARQSGSKWTVEEIMKGIRAIATDPATRPRDRLKAFELAGRHLGMYRDVIQHEGAMGLDFSGITTEALKTFIMSDAIEVEASNVEKDIN